LDITDDVDVLDLGLLGLFICFRPTLLIHRHSVPGESFGIRMFTDGGDHGVGFDGEGLLCCHRTSSAARILLSEFHFSHSKDVAFKPLRIGEEDELDVLLPG